MRLLYFFLTLFFIHTGFSQNIDIRTLQSLNKNDYPFWDKSMWFTSASVYVTAPLSIAAIGFDGAIHKDMSMQRNAVKGAITIGLASLTSTAMKYSFKRTRPKKKYPDMIIERDKTSTFSFPSGHTTTAFATATALTLSYKTWQVGVPAYIYAGLVGYARMRLGMHFPSDVLAGMIIGIGAGFLTWQVDQRFQNAH